MVQSVNALSRETRIWRAFARDLSSRVNIQELALLCYSFVKIPQLSRLTMVSWDYLTRAQGFGSLNFDLFISQLLVGFVGARKFEGIGDDGLAVLNAGNYVRTAIPMSLSEIGL